MLHRSNRETVEPIVGIGWIDGCRIKVHVIPVGGSVARRRPIVAVGAAIVERNSGAIARSREVGLYVCYVGRLLPDTSTR